MTVVVPQRKGGELLDQRQDAVCLPYPVYVLSYIPYLPTVLFYAFWL